MKSKYTSACRSLLIFTFICAVSIGTVAAQPAGRLVVLRSPNFGWNLGFHLQIDGRPVGTFVQGRRFDGWVPAGRHVLTVYKVPYAGYAGPTSTMVDVQPGRTYELTADWDSTYVFLRPAGAPLSPGALWQLPKWPR